MSGGQPPCDHITDWLILLWVPLKHSEFLKTEVFFGDDVLHICLTVLEKLFSDNFTEDIFVMNKLKWTLSV